MDDGHKIKVGVELDYLPIRNLMHWVINRGIK